MTLFTTRRFLAFMTRIVGRTWEDCAQEIQEWMEGIHNQVQGGIPAGFNNVTPETLDPNLAAAPGTESQGWAAADHIHALDLLLSLAGDILTHTGNGYVALSQGSAADGDALLVDSTQSPPFRYGTPQGAEDAEFLAWVM